MVSIIRSIKFRLIIINIVLVALSFIIRFLKKTKNVDLNFVFVYLDAMAILLTLTREEESLQNGTFCSTQTTCTPRGAQNEFLILSHFTCTSGGSSMSAFAQFCPYPPQPQSKIYPSID